MYRTDFYAFFLFVLLASLGTGCKKDGPQLLPAGEQLLVNGRIYTVNPQRPWAEVIWVKDGVIAGIGTEAEVRAQVGPQVEVVDLQGAFVMPGLHDVHLHPLEAASENVQFEVDLRVTDPANYVPAIRRALRQHPDAPWLLGWGADLEVLLADDRRPVKVLDKVSTTRPIAIMEQTSHAVWVNSAALAVAGIDRSTPDPVGGVIMKDANGDPNGLLLDNSGNQMIDRAIASIAGTAERNYQGLVGYALPELARHGITSICDARTYWDRGHHRVWQRVRDAGQLTVRANLGLWVYPDRDDAEQIAALKGLYEDMPGSLLRINQIKLYADGIVTNTTCAMHEDFRVDLLHRPTNNGLNYITEGRMAEYIAALEPRGFDFHIHAIGNRGVHEALNAVERAGSAGGRHRLTHVEYVDAVDIPRFAALNVTADAQVAGDFAQPAHWHENDHLVAPALNARLIPLGDLAKGQARITLSSDWDVSTLNPFVGMQNAVTRAPQALDLAAAIRAYTIDAAYVMRQEERVGSLEVGKEADFVVLDRDLFAVAPGQIGQTRVRATYLQGRRVYGE